MTAIIMTVFMAAKAPRLLAWDGHDGAFCPTGVSLGTYQK